MPACCMKPAKSSAPPACCMKKRNEPTDSWKPDAESSLLEDEESPDRSVFCDSEDESSRENRLYRFGTLENFDIPSNIQPKFVQAGAHKSFPRTHVPRPSRNYSTYEDNQGIMDVKEVAEYRKQQPRYLSTPKGPSALYRGKELMKVLFGDKT
ncbi:hypothetical protein WA026_007221 [Henosepilachna vigintioctopunctata]|uniref:Uncharacterized protein n=1 Tax=Henosepilachna vigintioctopunctata TaxID=420089 RepID=A0AAW1V5B5_9CUCU